MKAPAVGCLFINKIRIMLEFEEWLTCELFDYCKSLYLIDENDEFDDWIDSRWNLLQICKDNYDEE